MAVVSLNTNTPAENAQRRLSESSRSLSDSFLRLSSGLRINKASDDAAGLAIASDLNTDARVFSQGVRNFNDGLSLLNIAEGALREGSSIVIRIRELATQSANGTLTSAQRNALDEEANTLIDEFNRIVNTTKFNNVRLIDGSLQSLALQGGYGTNGRISVSLAGELGRAVGTGTFTLPASFDASVSSGFNLADANGDGAEDVLTSYSGTDEVVIRYGSSEGTFSTARTISVVDPGILGSGDFNGDGVADLAVQTQAGATLSVYIGNSDGSFRAPANQAALGGDGFYIEDFNNDGRDDILVQGGAGTDSYVMLANSNGSFQAALTITAVTWDQSSDEFNVDDFNNDGTADILYHDYSTDEAYVLIGAGDGTFQTSGTVGFSLGFVGNIFDNSGDVNHDGFTDFVTHTAGGSNDIVVALGNGDGSFLAPRTIASSELLPVLGDINADGMLDLANGSTDGTLKIRYGNGDGTFTSVVTTITTPGSVIVPGVLDYTGDGVNDILAFDASTYNGYFYKASTVTSSTLPQVNIRSREGALQAMDLMDEALDRVNGELGSIGAVQGRLSVAINNLDQGRENYLTSASQIVDADVAVESAQLVRSRILQQAGAAVLAQANQSPRLALVLLGE